VARPNVANSGCRLSACRRSQTRLGTLQAGRSNGRRARGVWQPLFLPRPRLADWLEGTSKNWRAMPKLIRGRQGVEKSEKRRARTHQRSLQSRHLQVDSVRMVWRPAFRGQASVPHGRSCSLGVVGIADIVDAVSEHEWIECLERQGPRKRRHQRRRRRTQGPMHPTDSLSGRPSFTC